VIGAGVDLGAQGIRDLPPDRALRVPLDRMGARGLFVRVAHQGGLVSLYAHLSSYLVQAGDPVERGQLIGRVGLTGVHASNAHLHFGLFQQDDAIDPLPWLDPFVIAIDRGFPLGPLLERLKGASRRL
jgi:murein DD-endopeptidase MepM/ murein hydrolase activator NlpD